MSFTPAKLGEPINALDYIWTDAPNRFMLELGKSQAQHFVCAGQRVNLIVVFAGREVFHREQKRLFFACPHLLTFQTPLRAYLENPRGV